MGLVDLWTNVLGCNKYLMYVELLVFVLIVSSVVFVLVDGD